jgi:hypothetical protein
MFPPVNTKDPSAVAREAQAIYQALFPDGDPLFVSRVFGWAVDCFTGGYRDYQPIDARYHDLEHTMQGTLCMMRLLHGRHRAGAAPALTQRLFELGLLAILFHDTGYLKHQDDTEGTGAKYTAIHVNRSAEFARQLLAEKGFDDDDIRAVQNMIRCTGVGTDPTALPFQGDLERIVGFALGTADLLGQMAAADYVDKLPILFTEFAEAAQHPTGTKGRFASFTSEADLISKTPGFWELYVLPKVERDFQGLYRFLSDPYPDGPNEYVRRIEANIARLRNGAAAKAS